MKSRRYSLTFLNDWTRVSNRHSGMTLANISGDWLAGEWITAEVTLLGLGLTLTRWSRKPVPVESLGREVMYDDNSHKLAIVLPPRRNGEPNLGALTYIMDALHRCRPDAYDPEDVPAPVIAHADGHTSDGGGIVPHEIALARMRDLDDDMGAPGEPPRCKTGGCE
jgi:hypothetical protein